MPQPPVVLDSSSHAALTFGSVKDYGFTAAKTSLPLLAFEVPEAAACFPIIFPEPDSATPHALLGLGDKNIFVDASGRWLAPYLPLMAANYPFSLARATTDRPNRAELALAIDAAAPHFRRKDGQPLYDPDGRASPLLQRVAATLGNQYGRHMRASAMLEELAQSGVLAQGLTRVTGRGRNRSIRGLRVADRDMVLALPDVALARWTKNGLLELLHAHWHSLRHLQTLLDHPSCPKPNVGPKAGPSPRPAAQRPQ